MSRAVAGRGARGDGPWRRRALAAGLLAVLLATGCTQERQNEIRRSIQNWTGTDGVLEIYSGDKLVRRFLKIDKMSTAYGTDDAQARSYRYGYGVLDENLDMQAGPGEKRVYFEVPGAGSTWVFFDNPR
ncbi:MAG: hypothetical protein RIQ53_3871 [Pseudomonadota bacterium]